MKRSNLFDIIYWVLIIFQFLLCFLVFKQSNWEKIYLLNILTPSIGLWFHENRNLNKVDDFYFLNRKKFRIYRFSMTTVLSIVIIIIYLKTFKYINLDKNIIMKYFCVLISIMLIIMGNLISNIRPNEYLGVNNYFTRKRLDVWKKTNSWSGKFLVFNGILSLVINSITPANQLIFNFLERIYFIIILGVLSVICPIIYSWIIYAKIKKTEIIQ